MTHEMNVNMYTVKQVAEMAGVTIKTLHHYDALGLLHPASVSAAGYRLYGNSELERLQQIMFYRELDVPLRDIKSLIEGEENREAILTKQRALLSQRRERLGRLIQTIDASIRSARKGETMDADSMFKGFKTEQEWKEAMKPHNDHLNDEYNVDLSQQPIDPKEMNESAAEAKRFMDAMAKFLRDKISHDDPKVNELIKNHIAFLNEHGHKTSAKGFAAQTTFFMSDAFHRDMLESQQTGLAYYLSAAAGAYEVANG